MKGITNCSSIAITMTIVGISASGFVAFLHKSAVGLQVHTALRKQVNCNRIQRHHSLSYTNKRQLGSIVVNHILVPRIGRGQPNNDSRRITFHTTAISLSTSSDNSSNVHASTIKAVSSSSTSTTTTPVESSSLPPIPKHIHRVVMMRHGESAFNNANIFTGWCDVALTQRGIVEAVEAGEVFRSQNIMFRQCYTSLLTRSIITAHRSLEAAGASFVPIQYDWRLNERHYGALQGLSKDRIADQLGTTRVMAWRRSYTARPPIMTEQHPHYPIIQDDIRYRHVKDLIPKTESLQDCQHRVIEAWYDIVHDLVSTYNRTAASSSSSTTSFLDSSQYTLIVAHANSLRALVMHLDNIPEEDIESLNIPTGIPFYYDIDLTTSNGTVVFHDDINDKNDILSESNDSIKPSSSTKKQKDNHRPRHHSRRHQQFRGTYISDERKKRNFLERRRAANDPWLWALHDDQVSRSMLLSSSSASSDDEDDMSNTYEQLSSMTKSNAIQETSIVKGVDNDVDDEALLVGSGINEEAARNTKLFGSTVPPSLSSQS